MSTVHRNVGKSNSSLFSEPYCHWSDRERLAYYRARDSVRYFPVLDETQVTPEKLEAILVNRFEFNGECYQLPADFDWLCNPSSDIEWLILLHKFYYGVGLGRAYYETADERYASKWLELTQRWMDTVPVNAMSSDVSGRRIQNWIFAYYYFVSTYSTPQLSAEFHRRFLESLHTQVEYLCLHLTPARNHRTLELYAIFLAAVVFPEFEAASNWLDFAMAELAKNIATDILDDGVHCELSTDYHHIVLRNYLGIKRLAVLNNIVLPQVIDRRLQKALEFSLHVHRPDGKIPAISDGDSSDFRVLLQQGHDLYGRKDCLFVATQGAEGSIPRDRCRYFEHSGYSVLRSHWAASEEAFDNARYLLFDCAALGAGNHGHLDLLNIEVYAYGRPLIVDPGRYTYDESGPVNWRVLFRGTAAHNTVVVDAKNQTRYEFFKEKFKIRGIEPERELRAFALGDHVDYLHGIGSSHEYPVVHERKIAFVLRRYWVVVDVLRATDDQAHDYELLYHLAAHAHGKVSEALEAGTGSVTAPGLVVTQPASTGVRFELREGYVSETYGVRQSAPVLSYSQRGVSAAFHTVLYPYAQALPHVHVEAAAVYRSNRLCKAETATALTISIEESASLVCDTLLFQHDGEDGECEVDRQTLEGGFAFSRHDVHGKCLMRESHSAIGVARTVT